MTSTVAIAAVSALAVLFVVALRRLVVSVSTTGLVAFDLRFPTQLGADAVEAWVTSVAGLTPPWWLRPFTIRYLILETTADHTGINHTLIVPERLRHQIEDSLQAHLPSARYEQIPVPNRAATVGAAYRISTGDRVFRVDAHDLSVGLLTSLQPLNRGESVTVQWLLSPSGPVTPARKSSPQDQSRPWSIDASVLVDGEAITALRNKQSSMLVLGVARIGAHAGSMKRARQLVHKAETPWYVARAPGVHLRRRLLPEALVARQVVARSVPLVEWPVLVNAQEASGLIGVPVEVDQLPGLALGGCRQLAPSRLIPSKGLVVAHSTYPGNERPLALDVQAQLRHLHVCGPTGVGKSTNLIGLITQEMVAGRGVTVLDPKGDLVTDLSARIPAGHESDVIVLDASDDEHIVGLNPLRAGGVPSEVLVENLVGMMRSLWAGSWGPRTDDILRAALMTLAAHPGMTLVEVGPLLLDDNFRRRLVAKIDDPVGLGSFWAWYENLSAAEKATVVAAPLNKLRGFTMRPRLRRILGQSEPKLDMGEVINEGKILLVNLASGLLGEGAAQLIGATLVAELWNATTARASIPSANRRLHVAYLDEFQHFLHLPTPMATVLAEARGLGLGLVLAHQHLHQLEKDTREAILANARSRIVFQCGATDARMFAKEFGPPLTPDDLQGLGAWEVVASLYAGGQVNRPCTARTSQAPLETGDAAVIRNLSARRYGTPAADIDAQIAARTGGATTGPVGAKGRRRRHPSHANNDRGAS